MVGTDESRTRLVVASGDEEVVVEMQQLSRQQQQQQQQQHDSSADDGPLGGDAMGGSGGEEGIRASHSAVLGILSAGSRPPLPLASYEDEEEEEAMLSGRGASLKLVELQQHRRGQQKQQLEAAAEEEGHAVHGFHSAAMDEETLGAVPHDSVPDMWSRHYIGLYAHSLASGLISGSITSAASYCTYVYNGSPNLCANSWNIMTISYNFSFLFGLFSEIWRPFGLRRKPFILAGWAMTVAVLLYLVLATPHLNASQYVAANVVLQTVNLVAMCSADGYFIELGQMEPSNVRGGIIVTGMMINTGSGVISALIQALLTNGPATNGKDCRQGWDGCWGWGLTLQGYYLVITVLVLVLVLPMLIMREPYRPDIPQRSIAHFGKDMWKVMKLKPTFYLSIYCLGINLLGTLMPYNAVVALTQYVLRMGSFLSGLDSLLTTLSSVLALHIFEKYLMHLTWRWVNYVSCLVSALLNSLWVVAFWNLGGLRNAWFAIFIDLGQLFAFSINGMLMRFVVVELALPGQEATLFELMSTIQSASYTLNLMLGTLLTTPLGANACSEQTCEPGRVDTSQFDATGGPRAFTMYTLTCMGIALGGTALFTRFLPDNRHECLEWKKQSSEAHHRLGSLYAWLNVLGTLALISLGVILAILLLQPSFACQPWLGGSGCSKA